MSFTYTKTKTKKIKFVLVFFLMLMNFTAVQAQVGRWTKDRVNAFLLDTLPIEQPRFLAYPTIAYSPETRWEFGISALYIYYAKRDTINRLSEISAFTFITQESQYGFWLDHALYSDRNKWFYLGRFRWQSFPLLYYGIGPDTNEDPLAVVDANYLLFRERLLRKVYKSYYIGLEVDLQRLSNVGFNWEENADVLPVGAGGSTNLGLGLGIVHDDRHNVLNVRKGWFAELAYLRYGIGNNALNFSNLLIENRWYIPIRKSEVLAMQLLGQFVGGEVPFNQMAMMGGESLMRGYYLGRYRDRAMVAGQVEYRWLPFPFSKRWGGAAFLGLGQVAPEVSELQLSRLLPAGGVGLRFLLFKKKDIYTRVDVAFTEEGPGFYFFIGEAF